MNDVIEKMKTIMAQKGLATPDELIGCSQQEIKAAMDVQNVARLPKMYEDFLLAMGKNAGKLWKHGGGYTYPDIERFKEQAKRLLKVDRDPIVLPDDAFVFVIHEGMIFYYFLTTEGDDPPVYVYSEIEFTHEQVDERLSDYLLNVY